VEADETLARGIPAIGGETGAEVVHRVTRLFTAGKVADEI
jgi:hypothetical protein